MNPLRKMLTRWRRDDPAADVERAARSIERWAAVRRILDAVAHRGETFAAYRLSDAMRRVRRVAGPQAGLAAIATLEGLVAEMAGRGQMSRARKVNSWVLEDLTLALGPFDPDVVRVLHRHSQLLWRTGDTLPAIAAARQVVELCEAGTDEAERLAARAGLGIILADSGHLAEAQAIQQEVLDGRLELLGDEHPATFRAMIDLYLTQVELHEQASASELLARIQQARIATFPARCWAKGFDLLLEMNAIEFGEQRRLATMLKTGRVPPRQRWPRDLFEM